MSTRPKPNVTDLETEKLAREIMALFGGNDDVHAEYWEKKQAPDWKPGMKREDGYKTVRGKPITPEIWSRHLFGGKRGLVLALARTNGKCRAAALDIDEYGNENDDFDVTLMNNIKEAKLPVYYHKSKSGGGRVIVFYDDDIEIETSVAILRGLQKRLGLGECRCEYYPPVQQPPDESGEPLRKQLNMPYFGDKYPVFTSGTMQPMPLRGFVSVAKHNRMNAKLRDNLAKLGAPPKPSGGRKSKNTELDRGKRWATSFLAQYAADLETCPEGSHDYVNPRSGKNEEREGRNSVLAAHAHHLGQMIASNWLDYDVVLARLQLAVQHWGNPDKTDETLVRQLQKGTSKPHDPLPDDDLPKIVSWRKIVSDGEDPHWFVLIEGSDREMKITDVRDITDYRRFANQCVAQLNMFYRPVKNAQNKWQEALKNASHLMTEEQAPEDTTPRGRFVELLETYLTNRRHGTNREDLLRDVPWEDEVAARYEFTMKGLTKYLEKEKVRNMTPHDCGQWIRKLGGYKLDTSVKGKSVHLWWVPSTAVQKTPALSTPELPEKPI
jgi:hypothetical protein